MARYLRRIRGISLGPVGVELDWRERSLSLLSLLERLEEYAEDNRTFVVVAVDEAQDLRLLKGIDFARLLAYSNDNLKRISS